VDYIGYDPSENYIQHAKRRFGNRGQFHVGFFNGLELEKHTSFDIVLATGLLHHMDDAQLTSMMALAHRALKPGGRLITIDPVFFNPQNPIAKILIKMDRGQNVRTGKGYSELASHVFSEVKGLVRHRTWVPYTHWIMECRK
jgi:SAM-dependent methyltransferase